MTTVLDSLLPMKVGGVSPGYGSFFTIDLDSSAGERNCLWIYLCGWAILTRQHGSIDSDSPKIDIDNFLLQHWKPKQLVSASINDRIEIDFKFDNSRLHLFPYPKTYGEDADIFRFFDENKVYYLNFKDKKIKEAPNDRKSRIKIGF